MGVNFILQGAEANISRIKKGTEILQEEWNKTEQKAPFYRIVVADSRFPRDGRCIEEIGTYDPTKDPSEYHVNEELAKKWLANGAQPTDTVARIFKNAGIEK